MAEIRYVQGDATRPIGYGHKVIVHCCNDIGAWGAGFVLALSKRWPVAESFYRDRARYGDLILGETQFVAVERGQHPDAPRITVANLIGQRGTQRFDQKRPVRYDAISDGLDRVATFALNDNASVHMPRMGCGLAGGDWRIISALVEESLIDAGIPVTVYDF